MPFSHFYVAMYSIISTVLYPVSLRGGGGGGGPGSYTLFVMLFSQVYTGNSYFCLFITQ